MMASSSRRSSNQVELSLTAKILKVISSAQLSTVILAVAKSFISRAHRPQGGLRHRAADVLEASVMFYPVPAASSLKRLLL
jgi:hypothetical protein